MNLKEFNSLVGLFFHQAEKENSQTPFLEWLNPKNKKNHRSRCSAFISSNQKNILIDTSPDIKSQLLRSKIKNIDSIVDITIIANKSDIGKLIGREGKMIGALKTVISGCKAKNNLTYRIKIEAYSDRE